MLGMRPSSAILVAVCMQGASVGGLQRAASSFDAERLRMVNEQLKARDIRDPRVLDAMVKVPRHLFVPESLRARAYSDSPLPIGYDQTISQPYIVAFMTQALDVQPRHRVLEIGTGSGYQAAVLGLLADRVYTIEIVEPLAVRARDTLAGLGARNIEVRTGNGYLGWPEHAPYDRIIVTAAPDEVPPRLVEQVKIGGVMVIPVGTVTQQLRILRRTSAGMETLGALRSVLPDGQAVRWSTRKGARVGGWTSTSDQKCGPCRSRTLKRDHPFHIGPCEVGDFYLDRCFLRIRPRSACYRLLNSLTTRRRLPLRCAATLTGCPATSVPAGLSRSGLPVWLKVVGPYLGDATSRDSVDEPRLTIDLAADSNWSRRGTSRAAASEGCVSNSQRRRGYS